MRKEAVYLCEKAIVDSRSNMMSLINIHGETINTAGFPIIFNSITFVVILVREENEPIGTYTGLLRVKNNTKVLIDSPVNFAFKNQSNSRVIIELNGLVISEPGIIQFDLHVNEVNIDISYSRTITPQIQINQ